jgi:hypothetical protein
MARLRFAIPLATMLAVVVPVALPGAAGAAAPVNDDFANAKLVDTQSLPFVDTVDVSEASVEADEPQNCDVASHTVWYTFTPTVDAALTLSTFGSPSVYNVLNLYEQTGSGFAGLVHRGCTTFSNTMGFSVVAGTTYYVQIGDVFGFPGTIRFSLDRIPPPPFDDISNARVIPHVAFSDFSDSTYATSDPSDPSCYGHGHSVWYVFVPPQDMRIEAAVQGGLESDPPTVTLSGYVGRPPALHQMDCSDDSFVVQGFRKAHVEFNARRGVPIYFMVATTGDRPGGSIYFSIQRPLVMQTTFDRYGAVTRGGTATVSGSLACSRPITNAGLIGLKQVSGRLFATGVMVTPYFQCAGAGTRWSVQINSSTGVLFARGAASVSAQWTNQCDSQGCQPGALIGQGYGAVYNGSIALLPSG